MPPSREKHTRKSFRLITLGGAALVAPDGLPVAEQRRRVAVLVLVAAGGMRGTSRDKLIALLSPDSTNDSARHALHQLLYYLRRQVGEDAFIGTDPLRLNRELVAFDVEEFEAAIARGALAEAAAVYRGPFLDGFHLGESNEFEEWASHERLRLASKYADVVVKLAQQAEGQGEHPAAAGWWLTLAGLDPLNAPWTIGLIRTLAAAGDRSGALRRGESYQARVRDELGAPPDPRVAALMLELGVSDVASAQPLPRGAPAHDPDDAPVGAAPMAAADTGGREAASEPRREGRVAPIAMPNVPHTSPPASAPRLRRAYGWPAAAVAVVSTLSILIATQRDAPANELPSLGVIPIVNTAGDSLEYLAEGIASSAADRLNRTRSVRAITLRQHPASSLAASSRAALARRVGVGAVLSGTLTQERDTVWLTAELLRSADGARLTGGKFAVERALLASIESDLLDSIALALGLSRVERDERRPRDPALIATLMRAEHEFGKRDSTSMRKAVRLYQQAVDVDAGSAEAYAGMSSVYGAFAYYGVMAAPEALARSRAAALRALQLDPASSQAIANLTQQDAMRVWDWETVERGLRDAIRAEPWRPTNWMLLGVQYRVRGRFQEALAAQRKARDLDPLSRHQTAMIAFVFRCAGEPDSAIAKYREAIALGSPFPFAHHSVAEVLASVGRYDEAIEEWRTATRESGDTATVRALDGAHGKAGYDDVRERQASAELAELMSRRRRGIFVPALRLADLHAALGDTTPALDWLERAHADREPSVSMIGCRWEYDRLRDHPRFKALLAKMHLDSATFGRRPRMGSLVTLAALR